MIELQFSLFEFGFIWFAIGMCLGVFVTRLFSE